MIRIGRTAQSKAKEAPPSSIQEGNRRVLAVKATLLLFFVLVALRLVQIQVVDSGKYRDLARRQYEKPQEIPAQRGTICLCDEAAENVTHKAARIKGLAKGESIGLVELFSRLPLALDEPDPQPAAAATSSAASASVTSRTARVFT